MLRKVNRLFNNGSICVRKDSILVQEGEGDQTFRIKGADELDSEGSSSTNRGEISFLVILKRESRAIRWPIQVNEDWQSLMILRVDFVF